MDGLLHCLDHFARQTAQAVARGDCVLPAAFSRDNRDVFDEDGHTMNWLMAEGPLAGGELEGIGDLVGEVVWVDGLIG